MKLLELTWSRYNGTVARFNEGKKIGFRLSLQRPHIRLADGRRSFKVNAPLRRMQESNRAYIASAQTRRSRGTKPARPRDLQNASFK